MYRVTHAQAKVVHHGLNAPENMSAMTRHAIGYDMRKHRTTKVSKQVLVCCCVHHALNIARIPGLTKRALTTWHRNKKHQCMSVLGRAVTWTSPVHVAGCSTRKTFRNAKLMYALHHSRADPGCASWIVCTRKHVSNVST